MNFKLGKKYIVKVTEKGIIPREEFLEERYINKDFDDLEFLTDEEKVVVVNSVLDKIRAEIIEYAMPDFEYHGCGGSQKIVELEDVLQIIDKYKAESEGD